MRACREAPCTCDFCLFLSILLLALPLALILISDGSALFLDFKITTTMTWLWHQADLGLNVGCKTYTGETDQTLLIFCFFICKVGIVIAIVLWGIVKGMVDDRGQRAYWCLILIISVLHCFLSLSEWWAVNIDTPWILSYKNKYICRLLSSSLSNSITTEAFPWTFVENILS